MWQGLGCIELKGYGNHGAKGRRLYRAELGHGKLVAGLVAQVSRRQAAFSGFAQTGFSRLWAHCGRSFM